MPFYALAGKATFLASSVAELGLGVARLLAAVAFLA